MLKVCAEGDGGCVEGAEAVLKMPEVVLEVPEVVLKVLEVVRKVVLYFMELVNGVRCVLWIMPCILFCVLFCVLSVCDSVFWTPRRMSSVCLRY